MVTISEIECGTRAARAKIKAGDILLSINGNEINDVLDYRFYLTERVVVLELLRGEKKYKVKIKKEEYEDIGLGFETALMDKKQSCKNGCIFCFIDQNPKGMRDAIYFKDDDSRLSFLHGNYVTLTNMTDKDVERIIKMHISPVNVSVHTTNPELRVKMMKNKRSGEVLRYLKDFYDAGIAMCAQIVLCRGINDGDELLRTLSDLSEYYPVMGSVSVVPAGLTRFREGLYPLADFSALEAAAVIDAIDAFEREKRSGKARMFFAADEFYLKAGRELPNADYYGEYEQIENGVGMLRSFKDGFFSGLSDLSSFDFPSEKKRTVSIATGVASYDAICEAARALMGKVPNLKINVYKIINHYYGESITVSGLLTGKDISEQLLGKELGDELLISECCLRAVEDDFLCGMTRAELSDILSVPVRAVPNEGYDFLECLLGAT